MCKSFLLTICLLGFVGGCVSREIVVEGAAEPTVAVFRPHTGDACLIEENNALIKWAQGIQGADESGEERAARIQVVSADYVNTLAVCSAAVVGSSRKGDPQSPQIQQFHVIPPSYGGNTHYRRYGGNYRRDYRFGGQRRYP